MEPKQPIVSVILPINNASSYLASCLESLLSQNYTSVEIIAIDDQSRDKSYKIVRQFAKTDKRIRAFRNKKKYGPKICLNRALKKARGQFIAFMSPTDIVKPNRIKKQVDYLLSHPKVVAVGSQCLFIDENNKRIGKSAFPNDSETIAQRLLPGLSLQFETTLINKHLLPKDLLYFKTNRYPLIYAEVFMKLFAYGEFANLKEYLHLRRDEAIKTYSNNISDMIHMVSLGKLLVKSIALYDHRPSLQSLFLRLAK